MDSSRKTQGTASSLSISGPHAASAGRLSPIRESRQDDGAAVKRVAGANSAPPVPQDPTIADLGLFGLKQKKREVRRGGGRRDMVIHLCWILIK